MDPITGRQLYEAHRTVLIERYEAKIAPDEWPRAAAYTQEIWCEAAKLVNNHFHPQFELQEERLDRALRYP
jgi:hypothetical protein